MQFEMILCRRACMELEHWLRLMETAPTAQPTTTTMSPVRRRVGSAAVRPQRKPEVQRARAGASTATTCPRTAAASASAATSTTTRRASWQRMATRQKTASRLSTRFAPPQRYAGVRTAPVSTRILWTARTGVLVVEAWISLWACEYFERNAVLLKPQMLCKLLKVAYVSGNALPQNIAHCWKIQHFYKVLIPWDVGICIFYSTEGQHSDFQSSVNAFS